MSGLIASRLISFSFSSSTSTVGRDRIAHLCSKMRSDVHRRCTRSMVQSHKAFRPVTSVVPLYTTSHAHEWLLCLLTTWEAPPSVPYIPYWLNHTRLREKIPKETRISTTCVTTTMSSLMPTFMPMLFLGGRSPSQLPGLRL